MLKPFIIFLILHFILHKSSGEKFIVNSDAGSDDAIALLMLLRYEAVKPPSSTFEIIAITCSYGNTNEEQVEINVLKTLTVAGRNDIPVYSGVKKPFIEQFHTDNYYGSDGFGNAKLKYKITSKVDKSKQAANALIDIVNENAGNISIISLGPLTNIALAIALDNEFTKKVKQFYVMGGSVAGVGNIRPGVEFNFAADPESDYMLFNATKESQITLLPWETSFNIQITKDWRTQVLGKYNSPYIKFANKIEANSIAKKEENKWISADSVLATCIIEPALMTTEIVRNVNIVTDGGVARGIALVDYNGNSGKVANTRIVQAINETLIKELYVRYLTCEKFAC